MSRFGSAWADADAACRNAYSSFSELDTAIKQKDAAAFERAYGDLTTGCNQCHQATNHRMVVIKVPNGNPFPDQDLEAPRG